MYNVEIANDGLTIDDVLLVEIEGVTDPIQRELRLRQIHRHLKTFAPTRQTLIIGEGGAELLAEVDQNWAEWQKSKG